jgi:hypothetical protein
VQIHPNLQSTRLGEPRINQPDKPDSFSILPVGDIDLYLYSDADWDELVKAVRRGSKQWQEYRHRHGIDAGASPALSRGVAKPEPEPPACGQRHPSQGGLSCTRPEGHAGGHRDERKDEYWPQRKDADETSEPVAHTEPVRCDADWGSATESQRCTKPSGHQDEHLDTEGYVWAEGVTPHRTRSSAMAADAGEQAGGEK